MQPSSSFVPQWIKVNTDQKHYYKAMSKFKGSAELIIDYIACTKTALKGHS